FLTTGFRYSFQSLNSEFDGNDFDYSKIENRSSALNGNIGVVLIPNPNWNISGMLSTGFRAPNVDDISKVFDSEPGNVVVPNPDLKPEYSYNAEISVSKYFNDKFELSGTVFYSFLRQAMVRGDFLVNAKDSIIYDGVLSKVQAIVNTGRANIYGFAAVLKMELTKNWSASMNVNYTNGKDLIANEPLRHTTPVFGLASIFYKQNKFKGEFFIRYNGKRTFEDLPPSERGKTHLYSSDGSLAWYTLNLRLQYQFNETIGINGGVENLLVYHYRTYSSGISAPGRNVVLSIRANI
ncbi:MAG: TonB-dependent receptor, partial [Cyclobacteriaceae bacterium]|nr:TonB-dependent receptor [Cyclobacteriaceae bacterium]